MSFGEYDGFPRSFGGDDGVFETYHNALLEEYGKVWDVSEGTLKEAEAYAQASMLESINAANERLQGQRIPDTMLEALPKWEQACRTNPSERDTRAARVAAVRAKLQGLGPNAEPDISTIAQNILGPHFVSVSYVTEADEIVYTPGFNPGPPGWETSSNIDKVFVQARKLALSDADFVRLMGTLVRMLDDFLPSWMHGDWYSYDTVSGSTGFILDWSLLDLTGL